MTDLKALATALAGVPGLVSIGPPDLTPLPTRGIAHDHVRIGATGYLARVPRHGQFAPARAGAAPDAYVRYQAASFTRAAPSGHVPRLVAAIMPSPGLPLGALIIEEIWGRLPDLPQELPPIAQCLARIHSLPVPPPPERPPLHDHADPARGTLDVIEGNARYLDRAGVAAEARAMIEEELAWARDFAAEARGKDQPVALVASDTHPGNFLIDARNRAMLVDVEKMIYGSPAIDLAHATLITSTVWDADCGKVLDQSDVAAFYRAYLAAIEPGLARRLASWLQPMRRLTWLRTATWVCRFKIEVLDKGLAGDPGGRHVRHAARCAADFVGTAMIRAARREWQEPQTLSLG